MVEVRPYRDEDRDALLSFMRASFENEVDEAHCESLISDSAGIWLATASEGTALAGFCRLVPDEETRARRRACMACSRSVVLASCDIRRRRKRPSGWSLI